MNLFQKETISSSGFDIVIGELSNLNGDVVSKGAVRIDGYLKGNINAQGAVVIGEAAQVYGNIVASRIEISGKVEGDIDSSGKLRIYSSGLLKGDIKVMSFDIDEGGAFEGMCRINTSAFTRKPKPIEPNSTTNSNSNTNSKKTIKSSSASTTMEAIKSKTDNNRANRNKTQMSFQSKTNKTK